MLSFSRFTISNTHLFQLSGTLSLTKTPIFHRFLTRTISSRSSSPTTPFLWNPHSSFRKSSSLFTVLAQSHSQRDSSTAEKVAQALKVFEIYEREKSNERDNPFHSEERKQARRDLIATYDANDVENWNLEKYKNFLAAMERLEKLDYPDRSKNRAQTVIKTTDQLQKVEHQVELPAQPHQLSTEEVNHTNEIKIESNNTNNLIKEPIPHLEHKLNLVINPENPTNGEPLLPTKNADAFEIFCREIKLWDISPKLSGRAECRVLFKKLSPEKMKYYLKLAMVDKIRYKAEMKILTKKKK